MARILCNRHGLKKMFRSADIARRARLWRRPGCYRIATTQTKRRLNKRCPATFAAAARMSESAARSLALFRLRNPEKQEAGRERTKQCITESQDVLAGGCRRWWESALAILLVWVCKRERSTIHAKRVFIDSPGRNNQADNPPTWNGTGCSYVACNAARRGTWVWLENRNHRASGFWSSAVRRAICRRQRKHSRFMGTVAHRGRVGAHHAPSCGRFALECTSRNMSCGIGKNNSQKQWTEYRIPKIDKGSVRPADPRETEAQAKFRVSVDRKESSRTRHTSNCNGPHTIRTRYSRSGDEGSHDWEMSGFWRQIAAHRKKAGAGWSSNCENRSRCTSRLRWKQSENAGRRRGNRIFNVGSNEGPQEPLRKMGSRFGRECRNRANAAGSNQTCR